MNQASRVKTLLQDGFRPLNRVDISVACDTFQRVWLKESLDGIHAELWLTVREARHMQMMLESAIIKAERIPVKTLERRDKRP